MKRILILSFLLNAAAASGTRPIVNQQQIIQWTPVIVEGILLNYENVPAPNRQTYFTHDPVALAVTLKVTKSWKGNLAGQLKVYTWALGKAPCTGIEIRKGQPYLLFADWNEAKTVLTFDFCRNFRPLKAPYAAEDLRLLNQIFP